MKRGDADAALAGAAHVVTETFRTQVDRARLPRARVCLAVPGGGRDPLHVYSQGQGVWEDRRQIASFLGGPEDPRPGDPGLDGGAFGGKEDLNVQGHAALLALATGRPVLLTLSREESLRFHPKRHPMWLEYTAGCDEEGRLVAVRARIVGDTGAYASVGDKVLERAAGHACGPYRVPNVDVEANAVYTNNPPCGAMRGFGVNQANFAIEGMLDLLAERVGIDGWEIRWRNALEVGDRFGTGQRLGPGVGLKQTLLAVRDAYRAARATPASPAASRTPASATACPSTGARSCASSRTGRSPCTTRGPRWARASTRSSARSRARSSGSAPERSSVTVDTEHELDTGRRPPRARPRSAATR